MAEAQGKRSSRSRRRGGLRRVLGGAGIALVGFAGGLVAGSVLEGPRLLVEWLRGPVRSVEVAALEPAPVEMGPLREVSDLHRPASARSASRRTRPSAAAPQPSAPPATSETPAAPAPRPAVPAGNVLSDLRREVQERPKPAPPAAPAPAPAAQRPPVVQVASTPDPAEAQRIVARLRSSGFDAFSVAVRPGGTPTHRVRVRTAGGEAPSALADRLRAQGFETWITQDP
jgi:cell division septation protein DedD